MRTRATLAVILFLATTLLGAQPESRRLFGPYLGQTPPGTFAEPFAPRFFAARFETFHAGIMFSPDGREAYWEGRLRGPERQQGIFESRLTPDGWSEPRPATFSDAGAGWSDDSPFVAPDGKRIFFTSFRPLDKGRKPDTCRIWVAERVREGWSEPRPLALELASPAEAIHWRLSVDGQGHLYFGSWMKAPGGSAAPTGWIYVARFEGGRYLEPERLGPAVNAPGSYTFSPSISRDGRRLLFCRAPNIVFASVRNADGTWSDAKRVVIPSGDGRPLDQPVVSHDGKYLFLRSAAKEGWRLAWVDASILDEPRTALGQGVVLDPERTPEELAKRIAQEERTDARRDAQFKVLRIDDATLPALTIFVLGRR